MYQRFRRKIYPMTDWKKFLIEGRKEFRTLMEVKANVSYYRDQFTFYRKIGEGAFGRVVLAKLKQDDKLLAIKMMKKELVLKCIKYASTEKKVLQALNHPFTVYLEYFFQDAGHIYLALPYVEGGDMFTLLRKEKRFPEELSRFYGAQIVLVFEYLHYCDLLYRDLKPENILLDQTGYLKLTDFGFSKVVKDRTYTMCGTPEYLAPEIILSKAYGKPVDWWAFGVLLYEMTAGYPPFHDKDIMVINQKIVAGKYRMPKKFSPELKDLVINLLQEDVTRRYGNLQHGIDDIKKHKWFMSTNWIQLFNRKIEAPHVPKIQPIEETLNQEFRASERGTESFGSIFNDFF